MARDEYEDYGPDLLVEVWDCSFHGSCTRCRKSFGSINPDQSIEVFAERLDHHANVEKCPG